MTGDIKLELIPESTKEELLNPSANLIGQAVRGALHLVLDPFVKLNIVREQSLKDFEQKVQLRNDTIPEEYRDNSKIGLALKALEDSKYQLDSEILREIFANLISSTLDARKNDSVQPAFSSILKDMTAQDAQLLLKFKSLASVPLITIRLELKLSNSGVPFKENILIFSDEVVYNEVTVSSLERLGLIMIDSNKLLSKENILRYSNFKEHSLYKEAESALPMEVEEDTILEKVALIEGSANLTALGIEFLKALT